jgi:mRNA deadenylase 3'-5' endonuclease subunit Ccr4
MIRLDGATESALERRATDFEYLMNLTAIERLKFESEHGRLMTEFALSHNKLKEVIESGEKFDLFIYDAFYSDALLG